MLEKLNKIIIIVILTTQCIFINCHNNKEKTDTMSSNRNETAIKEQEELYGIEFNIKVPCEIRINDLVVSKNLLSGVTGPEIINQYIKNSGKQRVSIKIIHPYLASGGLFDDSALKSIIEGTFIQTIEPKNDYQVKVVKSLIFPTINEKVPKFEYEWTFKANVPYKLSSWDDAQDLTNIDKKELIIQVVEKYRQLWNLLQSGNVDEFMKEIDNVNRDLFISNYYDKDKQSEYVKNLKKFYNNHKGAMQPMDDGVELVLLANGKGVALEQTEHFKGFGALMAKGTVDNSLFTNYITLIKSKKTNSFKIQLINSEYLKSLLSDKKF
jgi:hypothetical protein